MGKLQFKNNVETNEYIEAGRKLLEQDIHLFAKNCGVPRNIISSIARDTNNRISGGYQDKVIAYLQKQRVTPEILLPGIPADQFKGFSAWLEA